VAGRTAMDKGAARRAVPRLKERGLLARDTHGADRRRSVLELSDAGYRIYDEVAPMALARERALLAHFTAEDMMQLENVLAKLQRGLQDVAGGQAAD